MSEAGGVVIPRGRHRRTTVWSTTIPIHRGTCIARCGTLLVGLTEILPGVRVVLQLSFFLHNSNFFRQPLSLRVQRREQLERKTVFFVCEDRTSKATSSGGKLLKSTSSANPDLPSRFPSVWKKLGGQGGDPSSRVPATTAE